MRIHNLIAMGLVVGLPTLAGKVQAETFTVTKTDDVLDFVRDAVDCSLRGAIFAANTSPGPDNVDIPAGVYSDPAAFSAPRASGESDRGNRNAGR